MTIVDTILTNWQLEAKVNSLAFIFPDGCRDLIFKKPRDGKPFWFITPLEEKTNCISLHEGDVYVGYRLRPGTIIDEQELLSSVEGMMPDIAPTLDRLEAYTSKHDALADALNCLASSAGGVAEMTKHLGVSTRTLQRLVLAKTGRQPKFWLQLARARKAARAACSANSLAQVAYDHGYADQPHMNREIRRWFGASPSELRRNLNQKKQLFEKGYD